MTQDEALRILKTGANVFLTGEPGSGKTHTINQYTSYLHAHGIEPAITASTGIAATHINGMTIHSWSGIGVKSTLTDYDLDAISQKEKVVRRIRATKVLIIDEISMLSADTLDSVEMVCRIIRNSPEPFGGLQVIFVGDFFQLPPVVKTGFSGGDMRLEYDEPTSPFAFRSGAWKRTSPLVCYLHEQHRQEDGDFLQLLSAVRRNNVTPAMRATLTKRAVRPTSKVVTTLYPHNANVDSINVQELSRLGGDPKKFYMQSKGAPPLIEALKRNCLSPELLELKIGARVLFTKNDLDGEYVNGTMGEVVEFSRMSTYPVVKTTAGKRIEAVPEDWSVKDNNKPLAEITQVPLRLAWAITVHKSQGMSLDAAVIDLSRAFEYGQGYVALSRVRTLEGLYLQGFNERALEVHPEVLDVDNLFRENSDATAEAFGRMSLTELQKLHTNFIKASGGKSPSEMTAAAATKVVTPNGKKFSVEALREKHANAYKPWTKEDDAQLLDMYQEGAKVAAMMEAFGRKRGAITSRLEKLTGDEIT
ncbi:MAG: putative helicase [Candidatus Adlerbacteria bacterium]|nr:putative helicase [Candidatus Adlerbacteria bacterium]